MGKIQKVVLSAVKSIPAMPAANATSKVVRILLSENAATKLEAATIGKDLLNGLEQVQEGMVGFSKYGAKIEALLKTRWDTAQYLRILASFDWNRPSRSKTSIDHGKSSLALAIKTLEQVKGGLVSTRKYLAELKAA